MGGTPSKNEINKAEKYNKKKIDNNAAIGMAQKEIFNLKSQIKNLNNQINWKNIIIKQPGNIAISPTDKMNGIKKYTDYQKEEARNKLTDLQQQKTKLQQDIIYQESIIQKLNLNNSAIKLKNTGSSFGSALKKKPRRRKQKSKKQKPRRRKPRRGSMKKKKKKN